MFKLCLGAFYHENLGFNSFKSLFIFLKDFWESVAEKRTSRFFLKNLR